MEVEIMMTEEEYIKNRVDDQIRWYGDNSAKNKKYYHRSKLIEIISSASILMMVNFIDIWCMKYVISALAFIISLASSISYLKKFHERWIEYRTTTESLKHEKYLYLNRCPPYDSEDGFCLFVQNIESMISRENSEWRRIVQK